MVKKKALAKDFRREIKNTRSRFLSILILSALAVSFLSGLRAVCPDMKKTADSYMDSRNFMDVQIFSTLGFSGRGIERLKEDPAVEDAEGAYIVDAYAAVNDKQMVVKAWNNPKNINKPVLIEGHLPRKLHECAVDVVMADSAGISIGDTIRFSTAGQYEGSISIEEAEVTGVFKSPYFISPEHGSSTLGSGRANGCVILDRNAFNIGGYTTAFLTLKGAKELTAYSDEYCSLVDDFIDSHEDYAKAEAAARTEEVKSEGLGSIADAEAAIASVRDRLQEAKDNLKKINAEIAKGNTGLVKYRTTIEEAIPDAERQIAEAEEQLADGRRAIDEIEDCEWYMLSRESNPGYLGYGQDADRMANLAGVFPLLFFLIAALVCLTTMTRMVEEQRTQIGCLKALGYSKLAISAKYLGYGALPALSGGILGLVIGYTLFPAMIFKAWQIMYLVPDIELGFYTSTALISLIAIVACTTLSSLAASLASLKASPASLMRPKTPAAGKRVFLEYIKPLWKRLSFFSKVTARNLFRYKKRFFMTVIGIAGCTALIIVGFSLRYSIIGASDKQYNDIFRFGSYVNTEEDLTEDERSAILGAIEADSNVIAVRSCYMNSVTAETDQYSISAVIQACTPDMLSESVYLHNMETGAGESLQLNSSGVIIDQKLSEMLGVGIGDSFTVDSDGRHSVQVAEITENYLGHYIYMTPEYYSRSFGEDCSENTFVLITEDNSPEASDELFTKLLKLDGVLSVSNMQGVYNTYRESLNRVDFVVVIIILCAIALAVVVLYNLSNINVTERLRELATIKVLGFYDKEVSAYIYRENIILTIIGILAGIVFGRWVHVWFVKSVEIELMMFIRSADAKACVWAALITALTSIGVNVIAHFKMKEIDMVESLKSAE